MLDASIRTRCISEPLRSPVKKSSESDWRWSWARWRTAVSSRHSSCASRKERTNPRIWPSTSAPAQIIRMARKRQRRPEWPGRALDQRRALLPDQRQRPFGRRHAHHLHQAGRTRRWRRTAAPSRRTPGDRGDDDRQVALEHRRGCARCTGRRSSPGTAAGRPAEHHAGRQLARSLPCRPAQPPRPGCPAAGRASRPAAAPGPPRPPAARRPERRPRRPGCRAAARASRPVRQSLQPGLLSAPGPLALPHRLPCIRHPSWLRTPPWTPNVAVPAATLVRD